MLVIIRLTNTPQSYSLAYLISRTSLGLSSENSFLDFFPVLNRSVSKRVSQISLFLFFQICVMYYPWLLWPSLGLLHQLRVPDQKENLDQFIRPPKKVGCSFWPQFSRLVHLPDLEPIHLTVGYQCYPSTNVPPQNKHACAVTEGRG